MILAVLPFPAIDPVLIEIGPIAIRWYALSYIAGLLLGWWLVVRMLKDRPLWTRPPFNRKAPATADDIGDLIVWVTAGTIIGGRLGFVLFYGTFFCGLVGTSPSCEGLPMGYLENPLRIFAAWEGGMSFHGGLLGVAIATVWFCKRRKLDLMQIADLLAIVAPIGLFFGRMANFINGELWGKITDVPWAMVFPDAGPFPRHPSQIYEALLEGVLLFVILQIALRVWRLHERPGLIAGLFFALYGLFRAFVEIFRDSDTVFFAGFSMGQALSIPLWLAAGFFIWRGLKTRPAQ